MHQRHFVQRLGLAAALLALVVAIACSRRSDSEVEAGNRDTAAHEQHVPFHQDGDSPSEDTGIENEALHQRPKRQGDVPFKSDAPAILPAGTLLTVSLDAPISTVPRGSKTFTSTLENSVTVDGHTVWPQGATAKGRLECAHATMRTGTGYVCLTLQSIAFDGRTIPLQTSNLFVKGRVVLLSDPFSPTASDTSGPTVVRIERGHRLTFRLAHDVALSEEDRSDQPESASR